MRSVVWTGAPGLADEARPALPNRAMPVVWQSAGWGAVSSAVGRVAGVPGPDVWAVFSFSPTGWAPRPRVNGIILRPTRRFVYHTLTKPLYITARSASQGTHGRDASQGTRNVEMSQAGRSCRASKVHSTMEQE